MLELATGVAGPYAGKLFADLGADVVKVEPPGGDLQEVVTDARMRGLLQERTVRVYVVPRQRS